MKNRITKFRIILLLITTAISIFTLVKCQSMIYNELEVQLYANLKDVALQNKLTMEKELNSTYDLLMNITAEIEERYPSAISENDIPSIISYLDGFVDIYDFKRMGYISVTGTAYTTDNVVCSLIGEEVFNFGRQNVAHITGSLTDMIGDSPDDINVFGMPLFDANSALNGIIFATALTNQFKQMLNVDSFDGEGYSYIIKDDGTVITDSAKSPMYGTTNVFDSMLSFSDKNKSIIETLKNAISEGDSGYGSFMSSTKRYLYYTPLELNSFKQNWYLFTIVPASVLDEKTEKLLDYQEILLTVIIGSMAFIFIYFLYSYAKDASALRRLAYVDPLTNGDNYSSFLKKFKANKNNSGYIISIDFADFKLLNSICGVEKGNEILKATWDIISTDLRYGELAAHIRADQYVMLLKASTRELLIERIKEFSDKIVTLADNFNTIHLSPYFGIYEIASTEEPEASHTCAIHARNSAKNTPGKNWAFFRDINIEEIEQTKQIEDAFEGAIANREFEVWYQPKYTADTNIICGAEALVRWHKQDGTLVPPYKFIPLLEKNGKIITLDEYVFATVCKQLRHWELEGKPLFPISINVSRASLYFDHIVEHYTKILQKYNIKTEYVPLEITESATINNSQVQELVNKFREAGFPIYLDDFGNGYSSLATLNVMQFDTLKLDKSLVDFVGDDKGEKLLRYVIMLAKSLGMHITAEGVETLTQVNFLNSLQCDELQGYYFSKPLPCSEFEQLL